MGEMNNADMELWLTSFRGATLGGFNYDGRRYTERLK
jgi:hypothetical protein